MSVLEFDFSTVSGLRDCSGTKTNGNIQKFPPPPIHQICCTINVFDYDIIHINSLLNRRSARPKILEKHLYNLWLDVSPRNQVALCAWLHRL